MLSKEIAGTESGELKKILPEAFPVVFLSLVSTDDVLLFWVANMAKAQVSPFTFHAPYWTQKFGKLR